MEKTEKQNGEPVYRAAGSSIIGTRQDQQDAWAIRCHGDMMLAVVCDGMGGMELGGEASRRTVTSLCEAFERECSEEESIPDFLEQEIEKANRLVWGWRQDRNEAIRSGTTLVCVLTKGENIWWASVGDSKIYLVDRNKIQPVVREHNYRAQLEDALKSGTISKEEYSKQMSRGAALTSYVGIGEMKLLELSETPYQLNPEEQLILCSDGLYKSLSEDQIQALAYKYRYSVEKGAEKLTWKAEKLGGKKQDNTTVILISRK